MKKRILSIILCLTMVFSINTGTILRAEDASAPVNLIKNGDGESESLEGWVDADQAWLCEPVEAEDGQFDGKFGIWPGKKAIPNTMIYQDVDVSSRAEDISAGKAYFLLSAALCNYDQSPHDKATLMIECYNKNGTLLGSYYRDQRNPKWFEYMIYELIPKDTVKLRVKLIATRYVGSDNDAYFDDVNLMISNSRPDRVLLFCPETTIHIGDSFQLSASSTNTSGASDFTWTSSYDNVATVSGDGIIKGVSAGEVLIQAKDTETGATAVRKVTIVEKGTVIPPKYANNHEWAIGELDKAYGYGLIPESIRSDLSAFITREEFCEVAIKLYESTMGTFAPVGDEGAFTDTNNPEILKAFQLGIVTGVGDHKFNPKNKVTREQVATMLGRTLRIMFPEGDYAITGVPEFTDSKDISPYAYEHVMFMSKIGVIKGSNGKFMPKAVTPAQIAQGYATTTREQAVLMAIRIYELYKNQ